ncbi:L-2-amino-thiazoline-4-carboxylic acid hydrolase [Aestuariivirga sp.]|uniref:L-2-amino-thiazoline-4-carboxylic acid hydrolase n=1 Tax=Aestuariivirga sp. TaxID=2650926 RepID=UPI0039E47B1F
MSAADETVNTSAVPVILKRKLQAEVIGPIYAEMVAELGEEKASTILDTAIRKAAIAEGQAFAASAPGGKPTMASFIKLFELWTKGGALEIDVLEATDSTFNFDVTRCRYAETYRQMGLGKIGHLLSCNRDAGFCEGYNPDMVLDRQHTIMGGAPRCTFRYSRKPA